MALAREEILLLWRSDISQVEKTLAILRTEFAALAGIMPQGEGAQVFGDVSRDLANVQRISAEVKRLEGDMVRLQAARARALTGGPAAFELPVRPGGPRPEEAAQMEAEQLAILREIQRVAGQLTQARKAGAEAQLQAEQRIAALLERQQQLLAQQQQRRGAGAAIAGARQGQQKLQDQAQEALVLNAVEERRTALIQQQNRLIGDQQDLTGRLLSNLPAREQALAQQRLISGANRLNQIERERRQIQTDIDTLIERQAAAQQAAIRGAFAKAPPGEEISFGAVDIPDEDVQRLIQLQKDLGDNLARRRATEEGINQELSRRDRLASAAGATEGLQALDRQLEEVRIELLRATGPEQLANLERLSPGFGRVAQRAAELRVQMSLLNKESDQWKSLAREAGQVSQELAVRMEAIRTEGIPGGVPGIEKIGELPGLEQAMIGAFTGFTGRFVSTIQHVFSALAVFGAQAIVREFIQAAAEVERTFEDISTAIEFDYPDMARGTAAFDKVVEQTRRGVLSISDELNVLPATANEAAYVMIARFGNVNLALEATKTQLLATKVSTIDQSEALRALSAIAEGFAESVLDSNAALDSQAQKAAHDTAAVKTMAEALDFAVLMQQRFGVTVEDVVEGTANLNQIFNQLGFQLQETEALVGLVTQAMGQTGVVAADRLGRSIGQITTDAIRDDLLSLAESSAAFDLNVTDFRSGADAFAAIADQYQRIQQLEPETAAAITQIIGQRREAPTVAAALEQWQRVGEAVLGTGDAAGAAEKRFGFLSRTLTETIQSILDQFQALAQNLTQLGFISPLSVVLEIFDKLLVTINAILNAVGDLVGMLSYVRVGDFGLDEVLINIAAVYAGYKLLARTIKAVGIARDAIVGPGVIGQVAGAVAPRSQKLLGKTQGLLTGASTLVANSVDAVRKRLVEFGNVLKVMPAPMGMLNLSMLQFVGIVGLVTAGVIAMVAALAAEAEMSKERERLARQARAEASVAGAEARRAATEAGQSPRQAQIAGLLAEAEVAAVKASEAKVGDTFWGTASLAYEEGAYRAALAAERSTMNVWEQLLDNIIGVVTPEQPTEARARAVATPGTREFFTAQQTEALVSATELQIADAKGLLGEAFERLGVNSLSGFQQIFAGAEQRLAAAETPAEAEAVQAEIEAIMTRYTDYLDRAGLLPSSIEGSIEDFQNTISGLGLDLQLGKLTQKEYEAALEANAQALEQQLRDIEDVPELAKYADDVREAYFNAQIEADQALVDGANRQIQMLQGMPEPQRLRGEAEILEALLAEMGERGLYTTQAYQDILLRLHAGYDRLRQIELEKAEEEARRAVELARTEGERIAAMRVLARVLRESADINEREFKDYQKAADQRHAAALQNKEAAEAAFELAKREASAKVRLGGPILSRLVAIQAEIAAIDLELANGGLDYAESLELNIRLKELLAEQSRIEVETARAYVRATVSGRNQLEILRHELAVLTKEQAAVAQAYGRNSAEWYDVIGRTNETIDAIEDQVIAIRDVRRRLGTDVTDSFIQAQNDILLIMDQLRVPDLGKLEKAQLQLDLAQAQATAQRAFMDSKLFELEYLFARGELSTTGYIAALKSLQANVDTTSQQGKELWLQLENLINGMVDDVSDLAFNIPSEIRMPTLYEARAAVQAKQMRVNYQDQRRQNIHILISDKVSAQEVLQLLGEQGIYVEAGRYTNSNSSLTFGGA